jgi:hypothetical protein
MFRGAVSYSDCEIQSRWSWFAIPWARCDAPSRQQLEPTPPTAHHWPLFVHPSLGIKAAATRLTRLTNETLLTNVACMLMKEERNIGLPSAGAAFLPFLAVLVFFSGRSMAAEVSAFFLLGGMESRSSVPSVGGSGRWCWGCAAVSDRGT